MDAIKKSLDKLFNSLPRNAAAKRIKAEMLENLTQRYEELASDLGAEEAQRQVIAEIGPAEEIREAISLAAPKKGWIVTLIQISLVALCIAYSIFIAINKAYLKNEFITQPIWIYYSAALPLLFFFGAWLLMKAVNYYKRPDGVYIKDRKVRWVICSAGILIVAVFGLVCLNLIANLLGFQFVLFPLQLIDVLTHNSYLFGIAAVLIYLGIKK